LPVVDQLAAEYADRVDFVAPAWKSTFELTEARAMWGLDEDEEIFALYGVPYQPVTVLIAADGTVVEAWPGVKDESEIRSALENLISLTE
jgi:peroxiredoxin